MKKTKRERERDVGSECGIYSVNMLILDTQRKKEKRNASERE